MPPCRSCYGHHRHLLMADALAGIAWSDFRADSAGRVPRSDAARLCGTLPVRLQRPCGELLALGRGSGHYHFCRSCLAWREALASVPCHRDGAPRIELGYLALPELQLYPGLVFNCLPRGGSRLRSVRGRARARVSESIAHRLTENLRSTFRPHYSGPVLFSVRTSEDQLVFFDTYLDWIVHHHVGRVVAEKQVLDVFCGVNHVPHFDGENVYLLRLFPAVGVSIDRLLAILLHFLLVVSRAHSCSRLNPGVETDELAGAA